VASAASECWGQLPQTPCELPPGLPRPAAAFSAVLPGCLPPDGLMLASQVCRSCGCPRVAAGPHSISKDCAACPLHLLTAGRRQLMTYVGSGALTLIIGPFRARFPQLRVPQSCCWGGKELQRLHCLRSLMLQSGALAAEDMRWLWGPRTVIIGSNSLI
jgi:hypothetical protein